MVVRARAMNTGKGKKRGSITYCTDRATGASKRYILSGPGFLGVPGLGGGGGGVSIAHNSKTIPGIGMKFGRVVENHERIHLV